jgi:mRNA interferase MazF
MAGFVKGEVVVIPFPFSDLSASKRRPALVLADLPGDDVILCQITSKNSPADTFSIPISNTDFISGSLMVDSNIRPNRIFTADKGIIIRSVGVVQPSVFILVAESIWEIIKEALFSYSESLKVQQLSSQNFNQQLSIFRIDGVEALMLC